MVEMSIAGQSDAATTEAQPVKVDMKSVQRLAATPGAEKPLDIQQVMINIGLLMLQSQAHRYFFLADLEWLLYPPVQHHQFKLYMKDGRPVAYVSWARLSEAAEARFIAAKRLAPMDWTSGDRFWMIDMVAPYGGVESILADLRDRVLCQTFRYWHQGPDGQTIRTIHPLEQGHAAAG